MKGKNKNNKIDLTLDTRLFGASHHDMSDDVLKELVNQNEALRALSRQISQVEAKPLSGSMTSQLSHSIRKIERIYSKAEIRGLVSRHLIPLYQHEYIIQAVTNYLYSIHVNTDK